MRKVRKMAPSVSHALLPRLVPLEKEKHTLCEILYIVCPEQSLPVLCPGSALGCSERQKNTFRGTIRLRFTVLLVFLNLFSTKNTR